jgi:hypothetical protein
MMLYLGIGPVDWRSKQHKYVTLSIGEAEFISLDGSARAIVGLRWLLKETGIEEIITKFSSALFTDSTVAEAPASNLSVTDKTKHVAIKYTFVRELVLQGILLILRVHTSLNPADGGTKVLGQRIFAYIAKLMLGHGTLVEVTRRVRTVISDDFA